MYYITKYSYLILHYINSIISIIENLDTEIKTL